MSTTDTPPPGVAPAVNGSGDRFESCEVCGAPLDHKQRYCVSCAARRADPSNPATRYFAAASRRARRGTPVAGAKPPSNQMRAAVVMLLVLLPAAVGIGVLVGRSGDDGGATDPDLIAALDRQAAGTAAASTDASAGASEQLTSDFSLEKGYSVQIDTLPAETQQADANTAKSDAESKGASDVGILVPSEFRITPDPGGVYVLYAGEFKSKGDATKELAKLKGDFPDAKVITVAPAESSGGNTDPSDGAGGETVAKTKYGDVHKVENIEPTDEDKDEGMQIAQDQANQTGQSYIESQQDLPDVIAVGDAP